VASNLNVHSCLGKIWKDAHSLDLNFGKVTACLYPQYIAKISYILSMCRFSCIHISVNNAIGNRVRVAKIVEDTN